MIKTRKSGVLLLLFVFLFSGASAQKNFLAEADAYFEGGNLRSAIDSYKRAYAKAKGTEEKGYIRFQLGECHRMISDPEKAEEYYDAAIKLKYSDNLVYLKIADVQKQMGEYQEAMENYQAYVDATGRQEGKLGVESCKLAMELKDQPSRYKVEEVRVLNTDQYDMSPVFADRRSTELVFTSNRKGSTGTIDNPRKVASNGDLWITTQDRKGHWGQPVIIEGGINTEHDEGASTFDRNQKTIYFTRCEMDPKGKKSMGCEIWFSEKKGSRWDDPEKLELKPEGADTLSVGHPALAPDDTYMIFAGDLPGGQGGKDLWISEYDRREKKFMPPKNLGPGINTPSDELFPYIHPETKALFFSSTGHPGMGGLDIFKAESNGDKAWGKPENMGHPLNSAAHDYGIIFESADYTRGYLTSNRKGKSMDDLYSFNLPPLTFKLVAIVRDEDTKDPIPGATLTLTGTDNSLVEVETGEDGTFEFGQKEDGSWYMVGEQNYTLEASKVGEYLAPQPEMKSTKGYDESQVFYVEFLLTSAKKPIELPEVRYDYDDWVLQVNDTVNSKDSLNYLYDIMIENPTIVVQLMSHTDCRGSDDYNRELAQKRAQSCVDYLVDEKGIAQDRLVPLGKGEDEPLPGLECDNIEKLPTKQEREAAHQKNRRTNCLILRWDYVPEDEREDDGGSE